MMKKTNWYHANMYMPVVKEEDVFNFYSYEDVNISETEADNDYIGFIENNRDEDIEICFMDDLETLTIPAGDWFGILGDKLGYIILEALKSGRFEQVSC